MFSSDQETALTEALRCQANIDDGMCPACGDPVQSCACGTARPFDGMKRIYRVILKAHDADDHSLCAYSI